MVRAAPRLGGRGDAATGEGLAVHVIPAGECGATHDAQNRRAGDWSLALRGRRFLVAVDDQLATLVEPWIGPGGIDLIYLLPVIVASGRFGL